jgi:hypothetical protein
MTLRQRLDKLEGKRSRAFDGPSVIFFCDPETGEPLSALIKGGGTVTREAGESAEAFTARASAGETNAAYLPENPRDALATGKAPDWSKGELVIRHLRDKHDVKGV